MKLDRYMITLITDTNMKKTIELEREDLDALHDVILEALDYSGDLSDEEIMKYWNMLPEHLKADAEHWGMNDSVVRDNIYVWLENI